MQRNEPVERVLEELERYGLQGEVSTRGKHLEIAWNTPLGRRFVIAASTPSDVRCGLNLRSDVRRLLKADNIQPKSAPQVSFQKAMTLPKPVVPQTEVSVKEQFEALVDLVFDLQAQIRELQARMSSVTVTSTVQFGAPQQEDKDLVIEVDRKQYETPVAPDIPFRPNSKRYEIATCLNSRFKSLSELSTESGYKQSYISTTLWQLKKIGFAESNGYSSWRKRNDWGR